MSLNLGSLEASLKLNTSQFTSALKKASKSLDQNTSGMSKGFAALAKSIGPVTLALTAVVGAAAAATAAFAKMTSVLAKTQIEYESLDRLMLFGAGTVERANKDFASLKNISQELGAPLEGLVKSYSKLNAATKGTKISQDEIISTLKGVSQASLVMGVDAVTLKRVLEGLTQMASKGVVSMEDLRQQVGEGLPLAMGAMARAFGISNKAMIDLVSTGKITSEAVVLLGAQLQKETQKMAEQSKNSMVSLVGRMKTAWSELKRVFLTGKIGASIGDEMVTVGKIIETVTRMLYNMQPIVVSIKKYFLLWGESLAEAQMWMAPLGKALRSTVLVAVLLVSEAFRSIVDGITAVIKGIKVMIGWVKKFWEWAKQPVDVFDMMMIGEGLAPTRIKSMKQLEEVTTNVAKATKEVAKGAVKAEKTVGMSADAIFEKHADYIKKVQDMAAQGTVKMSEMATGLMEASSGALSTFFTDITTNFKSAFGNLFENLINRIFQVVIELKVIKPIMDSIFKTPGAGGGIWSAITGGMKTALGYAQGGIIPEPVVGVGMRSGSGYTFGEQGPEMVTPMGGRGGQGAGAEGVNQYNVTIQALDSQSAAEYMRRNPGAVLGPITSAIQHGNKGLMGALRTAM